MRNRPVQLVPRWRGSKAVFAAAILDEMPAGPILDLFGGGGSVVATRGEGIWNDRDGRLYRIARALQDDPAGFRRDCLAIPSDADSAERIWRGIEPRLAECSAAEFAWALGHTWGGRLGGRAHAMETDRRMWHDWIATIPARARVWRTIGISGREWHDALDRYPELPVFADPPYPGTATSGYAGDPIDFAELHRSLERHPAPVFRTGWETDSDWPRRELMGGRSGDQGRITWLFARDGFRQSDLFRP